MMRFLIFVGLVAVTMAKLHPQSCADEKENKRQCMTDKLADNGVTFDKEAVKACLEQCPEEENNGGGRRRGGKGGAKGRAGGQMREIQECMKNEIGDDVSTCVRGKVSFATVEKEDRHGKGRGGGGRGRGKGRGGRGRSLFDRATCSPAVEECVIGVVGDWYTQQDELKRIMCDAASECMGDGPSEACQNDKRALKAAICECKDDLETEVDAAVQTCAADVPERLLDRIERKFNKWCDGESREDRSGEGKGRRGKFARMCEEDASIEDVE